MSVGVVNGGAWQRCSVIFLFVHASHVSIIELAVVCDFLLFGVVLHGRGGICWRGSFGLCKVLIVLLDRLTLTIRLSALTLHALTVARNFGFAEECLAIAVLILILYIEPLVAMLLPL